MTSEQLDELERLARAATPGPWETDTDANDQQLVLARQADFWVALVPHQCVRSLEVQQEKNAAYIAAANPDAVLALIARVRGLEAEPVFRDVSEMEPPDGGSGPAFGQSGMAYWRERALAAEADRDRLAAEVERLRVAARDFLNNHSLDCGAHYCRYCPARSPEWKHETYCAYVRAQAAYTALSAVLAEAPKEGQ